MHRAKLEEVVSNYPRAFIDAFMNLLNAALYFQELSLEREDGIDQNIWEKHSLVVTRSCKLSSLFIQNHSEEDTREISPFS